MERTEQNAWKLYIESIRNPGDEKVISFKGLHEAQHELIRSSGDKKMALVRPGAMEDLINQWKNQISQLAASSNVTGATTSDSFVPRVTDQIEQAAKKLKLQNFVSMRLDPYLAFNDMGIDILNLEQGKMVSDKSVAFMAVEMDVRRMNVHFESLRILAPMIIFPDEILKVQQGAFESYAAFDNFLNEISQEKNIKIVARANMKGKYADKLYELKLKQDSLLVGFKYIKAKSCAQIFK